MQNARVIKYEAESQQIAFSVKEDTFCFSSIHFYKVWFLVPTEDPYLFISHANTHKYEFYPIICI
jgi:hypothetical protein